MQEQTKDISWDEIENSMISNWYFVSKIMGVIIGYSFPWFTMEAIIEEIKKDPNFSKKEGDDDEP